MILTVILSSKSIRIKLFLSNSDLCFAKMRVSRNLLLYSVSLIFSGFACIYSGLTPFSFWWRHKLVSSILILQRRCDFLITEKKYMGAISTFLRGFAWYFWDKKHQFLISMYHIDNRKWISDIKTWSIFSNIRKHQFFISENKTFIIKKGSN